MTRVIAVNASAPEDDRLREAAQHLRDGGLVVFPTETVYGLGAAALNPAAVRRIFAAKGRPATDPVIVHLADAHQLGLVARDIPPVAIELTRAFWPGALTLILPKLPVVPDEVTAGLSTVAVRAPSHPVAQRLIELAGVPVAAPSANRFGRPSPTRAEHVLEDLEGLVDIVLDAGAAPIGVESTIVDLTTDPPVIRRPGGVDARKIAEIVPAIQLLSQIASGTAPQLAPGQLLRHYAPRAMTTLYVGGTEAVASRVGDAVRSAVATGSRVGVLAPEEDLRALAPRLAAIGASGRVITMRCGSRADRDEAARDLFAALRALDDEGVDLIYATAPDGNGINTAIIDRLTRASEGRVHRITK